MYTRSNKMHFWYGNVVQGVLPAQISYIQKDFTLKTILNSKTVSKYFDTNKMDSSTVYFIKACSHLTSEFASLSKFK